MGQQEVGLAPLAGGLDTHQTAKEAGDLKSHALEALSLFPHLTHWSVKSVELCQIVICPTLSPMVPPTAYSSAQGTLWNELEL